MCIFLVRWVVVLNSVDASSGLSSPIRLLWTFGMTKACPLASGLMSRKESVMSSSWIL